MFAERRDPSTKVEIFKELAPQIYITTDALMKMEVYVDECTDEIGWLGTAEKHPEYNIITITDVYLFDQEVHSTTTEITPEGLNDFAEELLELGEEGIEIWNNLKVWGHSHVNMPVSPSSQDDSQMKIFKDSGHDWFIRIIANKKGDMKLDLYDYQNGLIYLDAPWRELPNEEERHIEEEINKLYAMIDEYKNALLAEHKTLITEEMKEKVRKKTYVHTGYNYTSGYKTNTSITKASDIKKKTTQEEKSTSQTEQASLDLYDEEEMWYNHYYGGYNSDTPVYNDFDMLTSDDEVLDYFHTYELNEFKYCKTLGELADEIELYGYYAHFSLNDIQRIFRVVHKLNPMEEIEQ